MNFVNLHYFLGIKTIKNDLNRLHGAEPNPARDYSAWLGGLPRATDRKADWATAWRPGPAT
jgi:hypothetical protein